MRSIPSSRSLRAGAVAGVVATATALALACAPSAFAQKFSDLKKPATPLVLEARGSFYVGGEWVERSFVELGSFVPAGKTIINQMYVQYMVPTNGKGKPPVIMVHGMGLTGKSWETTPDGRMGFDEYFVRRGYASYVVDQVSRGRSGFDSGPYNDVRAGLKPPGAQAGIIRFSDAMRFPTFHFGAAPGVPFPDAKFPVEATEEFAKQEVPDLVATLPTPNPTYAALAQLASDLKGAVLMTHSQSGVYAMETALVGKPGLKALVALEPGSCGEYGDAQIAALAKIPTLVVFGDYVDTDSKIVGWSWRKSYDGCVKYVERVKAAGGNAQFLDLPSIGFKGTSHMMMLDRNNQDVANVLIDWIRRNAK